MPDSRSTRTGAIPYLIVRNAAAALDWYREALGASEVVRLAEPTGKVMHAELEFAGASVMIADEFPETGYLSPLSVGGSPVCVLLYLSDVDAVFARAEARGAAVVMPVSDQFDGERRGTIKDPFGHIWLLATSQGRLPAEELRARFDRVMNEGA